MDVFSTLHWRWLVQVFFFSHGLGICLNLISFILEILYNCSDKAKSSSFLYQSEENATIIKAKIIGMFKTWNIHSFSLCKMNSQKIFSKSILRRQRQTFRIPKKKRFTIEFCRYHQMNHHWPCPNVREKMRKIYRVIRLRYVDGLLVQKVLSKDNQQLQNTILGYTTFIHFELYFLSLVPNQ